MVEGGLKYSRINFRVYVCRMIETRTYKFMLNYNDRMNSYLDIPRYIAAYVRGSAGSASRRESGRGEKKEELLYVESPVHRLIPGSETAMRFTSGENEGSTFDVNISPASASTFL